MMSVLPVEKVAFHIYSDAAGRQPFSIWLNSIKDQKTKATIRTRINRVRLGNFGNIEPVGEGVSELKIDYGPGFRIYFWKEGNNKVTLLCGGNKKTQEADIKKAKEYLLDYRSN